MSIYILCSLDFFFCEIILDIIVVDPKDPCHVFVVHFSNNKSWSPVTYSSMLFQKNKFDAIITIIVNIYNFTQSSNRFIVHSLIMNSHYLGLFIHPFIHIHTGKTINVVVKRMTHTGIKNHYLP